MGRRYEATGRILACAVVALLGLFCPPAALEAANVGSPHDSAASDPLGESTPLVESAMTHVFDTRSIEGGPYYVNDHTIVRGPDGAWHLFGIFHEEPIGEDSEVDFVHAVADEHDPSRWGEGAFQPAPAPYTIALHADRAIGETHLWAPHVVAAAAPGRWIMVYNGGGAGDDRASIRLAESDDLYRWTRIGRLPLFEDYCAARDPMLTRRGETWILHYTRCESLARKVSGVAYRLSRDLAHWSEPHMALALPESTLMPNSGFTESPFVFERGGQWILSVTAYPVAWDATFLYRSRTPLAFPDAPFARVRAHAAEWIVPASARAKAILTHAGAGQAGVWIATIDGLGQDARGDAR